MGGVYAVDPSRQSLLATMITTTSYGTWLPGDVRGYVEHGRILPASPNLQQHAHRLMKRDAVYFLKDDQRVLFNALYEASNLYRYELIAVSVESWHMHWLIYHRRDAVARMVGRLKTAMRKALERGRIWTAGYDKRYCFDEASVLARHAYIKRHAGYRSVLDST